MTRFRNAARLIPACGLVLALMVPAAGAAAPTSGPSPNVQLDKGGKGHGKAKHEKHEKKAKANKQKKNKQRAEVDRQRGQVRAQQRFERQRRLEAQQRLERQRVLERQRLAQRQREWERQQVLQRNRARDDDWDDDRWDDRDTRDRQGRVGAFVEVEGRLTDESWECRTMRGTDGRLYSLVGDLEGFDEGDRVLVSGRVTSGTGCPGTTIRVDDVRGERGGVLDRIFGGSRDDRWDGDRGELVNLRGRLASSSGCTLLRGDDGRTYELSGDLRGFGRGDSVRIVGVLEGGSRCGLGPSVRVGEIDRR